MNVFFLFMINITTSHPVNDYYYNCVCICAHGHAKHNSLFICIISLRNVNRIQYVQHNFLKTAEIGKHSGQDNTWSQQQIWGVCLNLRFILMIFMNPMALSYCHNSI